MSRAITVLDHTKTETKESAKLVVLHPAVINEQALWNAFRSGDDKALVTIYDRFSKLLYNYGVKILPQEDVVKDGIQEMFVELWRNRMSLNETDSIKFYLYKALRRKLLRSKARTAARLLRNAFFIKSSEDVAPSLEFTLIAAQQEQEIKEKINSLLGTLTKRQREAIFLRYMEELDYEKIAAIMELSKQAVYNLIHKAILQLKANASAL